MVAELRFGGKSSRILFWTPGKNGKVAIMVCGLADGVAFAMGD